MTDTLAMFRAACDTVDRASAAARDGDPGPAKDFAAQHARSSADIVEAILRSCPRGHLPTKVAFGSLELGLITPAVTYDCMADPLRGMLVDPYITEYVVDNDTESSGGITSSLAPAAGFAHRVRVIRLRYDTDPDQSGADDALETITFNPEHRNTELVAASQATTTSELTRGDVTADNTYRFTLPASTKGGCYVHFATREASLSRAVPERALISTDIATINELVAAARTIAPVTSLLVSGSLVRKTSSVISPALPFFEEYATIMLKSYYKAL